MNNTLARPNAAEKLAGTYLAVQIGRELFGLPNAQIRMQTSLAELSVWPNMPEFVVGFLLCNGRMIPVLDLPRLTNPSAVPSRQSAVIVVQSRPSAGPALPVGLRVDAVEGLMHLGTADLEPEDNLLAIDDPLPRLARIKHRRGALLDFNALVDRYLFNSYSADVA